MWCVRMRNDEQLLYRVAKLYYQEDLSQADIAEQLELSRPKVSRILEKARQAGIVNIQINAPHSDNAEKLAEDIKARFGIEDVLVVPSAGENEPQNLLHTVVQAGPYFQRFLKNGDKIGVAWGFTLLKLAESFTDTVLTDSIILQIAGNLDTADSNTFAHEIVGCFSDKLGIRALHTLPCPVIVENPIIVDLLLHDSKISNTISQVNQVDVAFPNIGVLGEDNCLWRTGYISTEMMHDLNQKGSVGCVCSRFINSQGEIVDSSLDERTISLTMAALQNARHSCVCIASENKVLPLLGCLRAGLVNVLALDSNTAAILLDYSAV